MEKRDCNGCIHEEGILCKKRKSGGICNDYSGFEDKPLTLEQVKSRHGQPVWNTERNQWLLVNAEEKGYPNNIALWNMKGFWVPFKDNENYDKEQPKRMVTLEQAIKEGLKVRFKDSTHKNYYPAMTAMKIWYAENGITLDFGESWEVENG